MRIQPVLVARGGRASRHHGLQRTVATDGLTPAGRTLGRARHRPVAVDTLEKPEHRNPVPIVWHADSRTFFVGTCMTAPSTAAAPTTRGCGCPSKVSPGRR